MVKKVIICGAGVGGLSCAHELSKNPEYEIHIYDRNDRIGGLARSALNSRQEHSEVCWKAISSGYKYFLNILDEVSDEKGIKLISHLKPLNKFIYAFSDKNVIEYKNSFVTDLSLFSSGFEKMYGKPVPFLDKVKLAWVKFIANSICKERLNTYDKIKWVDYINVSPEVRRWVVDSTSIYLGMDYSKLSTHFAFHFIRNSRKTQLIENAHVFYALDGPMDELLFNTWRRYLEARGVHFHLNHTISSINVIDNKINSMHIKCNGLYSAIYGDIFVNALSVEQYTKLIPTANNLLLAKNSHQIQTQVLYYLDKKLQPVGTDPTILIFPDSPWFLMTRIEGDLWETEYDLLSTGIGMWDVPGFNGKTALECTREELATECWAQINQSKHNLKLSKDMPRWDIWDSFNYDPDSKKMTTWEPKFSNNINTLEYRPNFKDPILINLYHANAYTQTYTNIFNMESGAEAGVKSAHLIQGTNIDNYEIKDLSSAHWLIKIFRFIDGILFKKLNI